ncbi:MAG TPA: hypothetical protein VG474_09755 [Solirubrobacteraceae bacterium]|nr:hypothetical protein [Solirubrobacteraceae bacterium]
MVAHASVRRAMDFDLSDEQPVVRDAARRDLTNGRGRAFHPS